MRNSALGYFEAMCTLKTADSESEAEEDENNDSA